MEARMRQRVALYQIISMVDAKHGELFVNNNEVRRVFNDENEIVNIEYSDGSIGLAADATFETLDNAIRSCR